MSGVDKGRFSSLANPNFRRYFTGQAISLIGTWMQSVGQAWLVLQLTGSGTALGLVVALQALPVLVLGPYGGLIADRVDKRRLVIAMQTLMACLALALGLLTITHAVQLWHVFLLAFGLGIAKCFENPTRQAFVYEMVGPEDLPNAISLNAVLPNAARAIGPAVAGVAIATVGVGPCFLINAASFVAVVVSLSLLDVRALRPTLRVPRARGQLRDGLRYVTRSPLLATCLVMMALVGCFTMQYNVVLPLVAKDTFHGGPRTYGFMLSCMGFGAVLGALHAASKRRSGLRSLTASCLVLSGGMSLAALAPTLAMEYVALAAVGASTVTLSSIGNSTLQLTTTSEMRGRVMALWVVAIGGTNPVGSSLLGLVGETVGARWGLALGGVACLVAGVVGSVVLRISRSRTRRARAESRLGAA